MNKKLTAALAVLSIAPAFSAVMVTETFTGTSALVTPGNTGDHTGAAYSFTVTEVVGCAQISFDITVSVGVGPVHFDANGFGDSGSTHDSLQATPAPAETMSFSIGPVTATPLAGSTLISNGVTAQFTSFDLVNNGGNPPAVNWTTDNGNSGTTTAAAGTSGGSITTQAIPAGATQIDFVASNAWMWLNNGQVSYQGDVVVEKVPEPSTTLLGALGALALLRRRRA